MAFNWIKADEFSFNSFLLMDRWLIRMICSNNFGWQEFIDNFSIALAYNPAVTWYFEHKSSESKEAVGKLVSSAPDNVLPEDVRKAEIFVIQAMETSVVYVYPEIMNRSCNYIYDWDREKLFQLADFADKVVLDVGSGTGRLAFAAAEKAKRVYASEPTDMLREYMRDKAKHENIKNIRVIDGTIGHIPYEDNTFDIVMSGHVVGDNYDLEINELTRVVKMAVILSTA